MRWVTPEVNVVKLPTAPAEKAATVLVRDAAAFDPGSCGSVMVVDFPPLGTLGPLLTAPPTVRPEEVERDIVGVVRHHQCGMYTGPGPHIRRVRRS